MPPYDNGVAVVLVLAFLVFATLAVALFWIADQVVAWWHRRRPPTATTGEVPVHGHAATSRRTLALMLIHLAQLMRRRAPIGNSPAVIMTDGTGGAEIGRFTVEDVERAAAEIQREHLR